MKYKSTRGGVSDLNFTDAFLMGLATDGGLIVPQTIPNVDLDNLRDLDYNNLAFEIFRLFIDDIPYNDLRTLIGKSYSTFDTQEVTPVVKKNGLFILELFHGPTFAFKDVALQFLGNLFEYVLKKRNTYVNVLGATSGDTGSAAIYGLKGKENINIFILHPHNKVSKVQELQMTTVEDVNVYNLAIEGTFDDCQAIVKSIFNDLKFKEKYHLAAVNSINWARILAQIVYYFYAYFKSGVDKAYFSVPTGNFGDIFAGYMAKRMGLPIEKLILATNSNDILYRFVNYGDYSTGKVVKTLSPSMDIQVASNFERYLYYLSDENSIRVKELMDEFTRTKKLKFEGDLLKKVQLDFESYRAGVEDTLATIKRFYEETGYIVDPHTAAGVFAAIKAGYRDVICLSTAHPAKFPDAIMDAIGAYPEKPRAISELEDKNKRMWVLGNSVDEVKKFIEKKLQKG
ncbi:threonine synthase [Hippea maritima]|uniref:Threonine synthase n=1 Tax=Hippea maritima (strain ATCC 700847 / DSM 10411 / MH2) TaxID=760142 RepID=F2LW83_HIPMA|nr:threonine synthase [Hippea maritima]AEA34017.1 threonine synthase [Hippea maritima DSM 10411]